jgi:hypothetical protein
MARKLQFKTIADKKGKLVPYDEEGDFDELDMNDLLGAFDDSDVAAFIQKRLEDLDDDSFAQIAEKRGITKVADDAMSEQSAAALLRESGVGTNDDSPALDRVKQLVELGRSAETVKSSDSARLLLLAEAVKNGKLDNSRAALLAREGKVTLADYISAQEAEKALDLAVAQGKILPRDRAFFFSDALHRPKEFAEWAKNAPRVLAFGSMGIGSAQTLTADEELSARVMDFQKNDPKLSYSQAFQKVLASYQALAERYHTAHRQQIAPDQGASA